jgi:hypothetical protein
VSLYDSPPKTRRAARAQSTRSASSGVTSTTRLGAELERDLQLVAGRDTRALR